MRNTIKQNLLKIQNLFRPESRILMYHRINDLKVDPWELAVSAVNFDEQLTVLKKSFNILSLEEMFDDKKKGKLRKNSVAITFDDGYSDNYTKAYPILRSHGVPATFFINSGYIENQNEFWPDKLIRLLLNEYEMPEEVLELELINKKWDINKEDYTKQIRYDFFWDIWYLLLRSHPVVREQTLNQIEEWANHSKYINPDTLPMKKAELIEMANDPLISIGGHTSNHVALKFQNIDDQREEIKSDKLWLEKVLGKSIKGFAYPNGEFDDIAVSLVQEMGFEYACVTKAMRNSHYISDYKLPRYQVCNWNVNEFISQLK